MAMSFSDPLKRKLYRYPELRMRVKRARLWWRYGVAVLRGTKTRYGAYVPVRSVAVSPSKQQGFFGYYDKCPWSPNGQYLLFLSTRMGARMPRADDCADVCFADTKTGTVNCVGSTRAWCWQQGAMLHWLRDDDRGLILHNDRREGRFVTVIREPSGAEVRILPRPTYALSPDGLLAASLNFDRLHVGAPGYGYVSDTVPQLADTHEDGIWTIDTGNGESALVLSLSDVVRFEPIRDSHTYFHYLNHISFNPGGNRMAFLHRWFELDRNGERGNQMTRLFTVGVDGTDLRLLNDHGMVSHLAWRNDNELLAWANHPSNGKRYYLFTEAGDTPLVVGEAVLTEDGHPGYSPNGQHWIATDTYPDDMRRRRLLLFDVQTEQCYSLGDFHSPIRYDGPMRCDLHPRWDHTGNQLCFDSTHEGYRRLYTIDVREITAR